MSDWPFDPALWAWGATYTPAALKPGQPWWMIEQADGPMDIGGNHHIYVDVWDEQGNRIVGVPVIFYSNSEEWPAATEAKRGEPYAVNMPMSAGGHAYGVRVGDGKPSDAIFGFGMPNYKPHHSFRVIFRLQPGVIAPPPPPPPPPTRPPGGTEGAREQYARVVAEIDTLGRLLDFA